jgi:predicted secreted protein
MHNSQKKNMHATLLDKDDPKRRNRLAKEFKHSYKIFWQNTQSSYL